MPACDPVPSDTCGTCPGAQCEAVRLSRSCPSPVAWINRGSKYSGAKSQAFCWPLTGWSCNGSFKEINKVKVMLANPIAHHTWSHPHPGSWVSAAWVPWRVTSLRDSISRWFLVLPWDAGLSQHPSPHAGLHIRKGDGPYSRGWVFVWIISLYKYMVQSPDAIQVALLGHLSKARGNAYSSKCIISTYGSLLCTLAVIPGSPSMWPLPKGIYAQKLQVQGVPSGYLLLLQCWLIT